MKLLILAGDEPSAETPPAAVAALLDAASEVHVVAPSIVGPLHWLTGAIDDARHDADDRLTALLGHPDMPEGTSGTVGDELAGTSIADALRAFDADHVLVIAASGDGLWRKRRVVERLLDDHGLTVTIALT